MRWERERERERERDLIPRGLHTRPIEWWQIFISWILALNLLANFQPWTFARACRAVRLANLSIHMQRKHPNEHFLLKCPTCHPYATRELSGGIQRVISLWNPLHMLDNLSSLVHFSMKFVSSFLLWKEPPWIVNHGCVACYPNALCHINVLIFYFQLQLA